MLPFYSIKTDTGLVEITLLFVKIYFVN